MQDLSPDHEDRLRDFFARHGGPGAPMTEGEAREGLQGWSEVYARDGYTLRCDWSRLGSREEMQYTERAPQPPV